MKLRNMILAGLAAAMLPLAMLTPQAAALGKVKCADSGAVTVANLDPIVNHNGTGSMHEHQIFGNTGWISKGDSANYNDLVGQDTTCRIKGDTAGYWTPTLRYISGPNKGKLIDAQQFTAYYRPFTNVGKFGPGAAFPADTRLVAPEGHNMWNCGQNSGTKAKLVPYIPDCTGQSGKPGHTLTAHVKFPSCWDGVLPNHSDSDVGDTRDNAHYAYPVRGKCPTAFPHEMVGLNETVQFPYVGNGTDVALSSDEMEGTSDGLSMHGDFWNGWDQPTFEKFVNDCVNNSGLFTNKECMP